MKGEEMSEKWERGKKVKFDPKYKVLYDTLMLAYDRAAFGKGKERHGEGKPFLNQYICRAGKRFGISALQYQISKKNEEILNLNTNEQKIGELLDIIVYAAAAIMILEGKVDK
jgi:hypothetical protein